MNDPNIINPLEYYIPPFKSDDCYIRDSKGTMCFDFTPCNFKIGFSVRNSICKALNKEEPFPFDRKWNVQNGVFYLFDDAHADGLGTPIMRARGWGHLTGLGGLRLPEKQATKVQDSFIEYCLNTLNGTI